MNSRIPELLSLGKKPSKTIKSNDSRTLPRPHPKDFKYPRDGDPSTALESCARAGKPFQEEIFQAAGEGLPPNSARIPGNPEHHSASTKFITSPVISQDIVFSSGYSQACSTNQFVPGSINCLTSDLNELFSIKASRILPPSRNILFTGNARCQEGWKLCFLQPLIS